ncbi:response regulator transcription factor [Paenibacillus spongiae]|uniref:Response regulator n=1 Tax=Paenibacillus spongiae TaxID=2909671 RepID=A0ABY5SAS4_9BACL|nr:response regulator [Paenibacillus spongiae]UVI29398.1 response regulator [Paenibacillus spongiae]
MYKVLIADDERMVRLNLRTMIERDSERFTVVQEAKDGEQALRMCIDIKPDLLITDIRMPELNGLDLIRSLSAHNLEFESLVVSGYDDFEYARNAFRFGVTDYLLKPIDKPYFLDVLHKIDGRLSKRTGQMGAFKDWLWSWKTYAEQTAESLWRLDEKEIERELERIRSVVKPGRGQVDPETVKQIEYYLVVLSCALQEANKSGLQLPDLKPIERIFDASALYETVRSRLTGLLRHIRETRNWWSYNRLMRNVKAYLEEHYAQPDLSLKEAASSFELSPNYFGNMFKKETGMSFNQYVTRIRMDKAMVLLRNPSVKLYEVGETVGFDDYTYFSKTFKKHTGSSPSDFRKYGGVVNEELP